MYDGTDEKESSAPWHRDCLLRRAAAGAWSTRTRRPPDALHDPVEWVGRWKFLKGWTKVWSCDRHADELVGARRLPPVHIPFCGNVSCHERRGRG